MLTKQKVIKYLKEKKIYDDILEDDIDALIIWIELRAQALKEVKAAGFVTPTEFGGKISVEFNVLKNCQDKITQLKAKLGLSIYDAKRVDKPIQSKPEADDIESVI